MNKWIKTAVAATATLTLALSAVGCSSPTPSPSASATASESVAPSTSVAPTSEASIAPSVDPVVSPEVSAPATGDPTASDVTAVAGSWMITTVIDAEGNSLTYDEFFLANGLTQEEIDASRATITLNEDGSAIAITGEMSIPASFTLSGTTVTLTLESAPDAPAVYEYDAEDDTLTIKDEANGVTSVLQRAS